MSSTAVGGTAIIPARGGSKRVPRKNVRPFLGVPLVQRTIQTLVRAEIFDRVVVTTDDDEIAAVAEGAGAEVPFRRPAELADDLTPTVPVILDALRRIGALEGQEAGEICVVYPAAVAVTATDLTGSRDQLHLTGVDTVMSATTYAAPILRSWRQLPDGTAEMIWPEHRNTRSQDLEPAYHDAGQFYWWASATAGKLERGEPVTTGLYLLPRWRVHDIDTEEDWIVAERAFRVASEEFGSDPTPGQPPS